MGMDAKPQKEHEWLQQLAGDWTFEGEAEMAPGESMKCTGTESVRSLGGLWMLAEGKSQMPDGSSAITLMSLGYDPQRSRYIGTFLGSMMTHLWLYDGALDPDGKMLTLDTEGPDMASTEGKMARYQDVIEIKGTGHRTLTSRMLGQDGKWRTFMTAHYRRLS
jgi:hypothetical protein